MFNSSLALTVDCQLFSFDFISAMESLHCFNLRIEKSQEISKSQILASYNPSETLNSLFILEKTRQELLEAAEFFGTSSFVFLASIKLQYNSSSEDTFPVR